jgi:protein tyrosine/serine phosphatase
MLAKGRLFRSASFADASEADIARLNALGVKFIVDLRRSHEREASPNRWPGGATRTITYSSGPRESGAAAPHVEVMRTRRTPEEQRTFMRDYYGRATYSDRFVDQFAAMFAALADEGGPFVVHCAVGKDRTGIACALIHEALGVDRDTIFEDFLLTNANASRWAQERGAARDDDAPLPHVGVHQDYLHAAYEAIEKTSGSVDAYLSDVLQVTPAMRERLAAHFVA